MDDEKRIQIINEGLAGAFWQEILKPLLEQRHAAMTAALRDPDLARKHKLPDDYVRGQLDLAEMLLSQPQLIAETTSNAMVEEKLAAQREFQDGVIAHMGRGAFRED